jgi:hypothetical protein
VVFCFSSNHSLCFPWRKLRIIRGIETLYILWFTRKQARFSKVTKKMRHKIYRTAFKCVFEFCD